MEKVRLDKWLWAARFFKTRSLASKAVSGGHVHLNGQRAKSSRLITVGEVLSVRKGTMAFTVTVLGLHDRRGPASQAQLLYEESADSIAQREEVQLQRRLITAQGGRPERRPDKRQRRKIREFIKKQ